MKVFVIHEDGCEVLFYVNSNQKPQRHPLTCAKISDQSFGSIYSEFFQVLSERKNFLRFFLLIS
jgi:hypothetical protein